MAKLTKEEWMNQQRERIGYDELSDDEKERADDCMDQAWDEVMGDKGEDSQDTEDSEDNESQDENDSNEDDEPEGREDREIEHNAKEQDDDEFDR